MLFIEDPFAEPTGYWWLLLVIVSGMNILVALGYLVYIRKEEKTFTTKKGIVCGLIYVLMCAWRSVFPVVNTDRRCFWDTDFATPIVSRSFATVGEMCFIFLFAIIYHRVWKDLVAPLQGFFETVVLLLIWAIVPAIAVAQALAWLGVATQNNLYNAVEVIVWTAVFAFLMGLSLMTLCCFSPDSGAVKCLLIMTVLFSAGFVGFEVAIDIPRYFADLAANPSNFSSFAEGVEEMKACQEVTRTLAAWESDIPWMTGYFTFGAWWCMILVAWNQKYTSANIGGSTAPSTNYAPAGALV